MMTKQKRRSVAAFMIMALFMSLFGGEGKTVLAIEKDKNSSTENFLENNADLSLDTGNGNSFQTVFENYISLDGTKLMDGDQELKFVSLNYPQATSDTQWEQRNVIKTIKAMGGNVTRSYTIPVFNGNNSGKAFVRGVDQNGKLIFDDNALNKLDQLLAICNEYGVRVIVPLVDHWHWIGGIDGYVSLATGQQLRTDGFDSRAWKFYSDETCLGYFSQMIEKLMNRTNTITGIKYKDDPAVICWETGNEIGAYNQEEYDDALVSWTNAVVGCLRNNGAKQLILDGRMSMTSRSLSAENKSDILGCHYYTGHYPTKTANDTANAHAAGKPFILGEFGGYTKASDCQAVFEAAINSGTNGTMMWSLRGHKDGYGYYYHPEDPGNWAAYHWPGFPSGDYYDETNIVRMIYAYAQIVNGNASNYQEASQIPIPAPESLESEGENPLLYPITTIGDIKWRGVVGGAWYEIQRADGAVTDQNSLLWETIAGKEDYIYDSGRNWEDKQHDCIAGYHDKTAITGAAYSYRLRACNESGESGWSNIITAENVKHVIKDDLQMISVSGKDQNPTEIRNVYSYDHSSNVTTSGGTLQNKSAEIGYIGYSEDIPIEQITIITAGTVAEGNEPKVFISKDDITYTQVEVTANSGKEYQVRNLSETDKIYYARVYVNGNNSCVLDSVELVYTYNGEDDKNDDKLKLSYNAMIQDDSFGENGESSMYVAKADNLAVVTDGEIKGLAMIDEHTADLIYKTGDDITAYRVVAYLKDGAELLVEYSMDGVNFTQAKLAGSSRTGNYTKYTFSDADVTDSVRVLRIRYPQGVREAIVQSIEISSGLKRLPMSDTPPLNIIEDGEYYFGDNGKLQDIYEEKSSAQGFKAFTKPLGISFEEYDALFAWIQGDNSGNTLVLQLTDQEGKIWETEHLLSGNQAGMVRFDLSDFTCSSDPDAEINLTLISEFSIGIRLSEGSMDTLKISLSNEKFYTGNYGIKLSYLPQSGTESNIYVDNIYVSSLTKVDDFEGYNGANSLLQTAYARNTGGGSFDMALDVTHKSQGSYGLKIDYNYNGTGYAGATKTMDYLNLKDFDGLMIYYVPDGSGNSLTLQIKTSDGLSWESVGYMDTTGPTVLYMPFDSFVPPSWDPRETSLDKTKNITAFSIYTNKVGATTSGTLYFDNIKGANFVEALAAEAYVAITTENDTKVTSFPYTITGIAGFVDYITLQIGTKKINVPVENGIWSYELTEKDKIYNEADLPLTASILYHNGVVIQEDKGKFIELAVNGNEIPEEIIYHTAWEYSFSAGLGNWQVNGFSVSDGVANKLENNNFLTWSNDIYSGTLSYILEVPNGTYTLGNDIRVKSGMIKAEMVLKSGDIEVSSGNLDTEDTLVTGLKLGKTIEVHNNQIEIIYRVEAPAGGMVFAVNNIKLYGMGANKIKNYMINPDFEENGAAVPGNEIIGWTASDSWGTGTLSKTEAGGHSGNYALSRWYSDPYWAKNIQVLSDLPDGIYSLSAWAQNKLAEPDKPFLITTINLYINGEEIDSKQVEATGQWQQYVISDIEISSTDTVIVEIDTNDEIGGGWTKIDLVELIKVKDLEVPPIIPIPIPTPNGKPTGIYKAPVMKGKWKSDAIGWWYAYENGTWASNTWKLIDGKWYAFNQDGYMRQGWFKDGDYWYYLANSGAMATGWVNLDGTWYYLSDSGAMTTGWILYKGTWYFLNESGAMAVNSWIGIYYVNETGAWLEEITKS